ncbi:uncharacterized protein LOC113351216 [Papaver somniferum]|uniref:uncharacterized protein LOC113351216 n=1 Tax=Papaver somniferum TaxID=3469 RepID=UPI000E6FFD4C|nr:uncharacterized protein LOC113351216 [Papaver somniferum]
MFIAHLYHKLSSPEYQSTNPLLLYKEFVGAYSSTDQFFLKLNSIQYYCISLVLFFAFYLLSVSATTLTLASLYLSKPLSYISILSTICRILKRLAITFLHGLPLIFLHYVAYLVVLTLFCAILTLVHTSPKINLVLVSVIGTIFLVIYLSFFIVVHGRFIARWNFANVVSVVEPNIYGSGAIKKSKQLLQEKKVNISFLVIFYFCVVIEVLSIGNGVMSQDMDMKVRVFICSLFVMALAVVNFLGLAAQNVIYYQNQVMDKGVLHESALEMQGFVGNDNRVEGDHLDV